MRGGGGKVPDRDVREGEEPRGWRGVDCLVVFLLVIGTLGLFFRLLLLVVENGAWDAVPFVAMIVVGTLLFSKDDYRPAVK